MNLNLGRNHYQLENLNNEQFLAYNASPLQLVYQQALFWFNQLQWDNRLQPVLHNLARQEYIQNLQLINLRSIGLYFDLLLAQAKRNMALKNIGASDTLFQIGKKRFAIAVANIEVRQGVIDFKKEEP